MPLVDALPDKHVLAGSVFVLLQGRPAPATCATIHAVAFAAQINAPASVVPLPPSAALSQGNPATLNILKVAALEHVSPLPDVHREALTPESL